MRESGWIARLLAGCAVVLLVLFFAAGCGRKAKPEPLRGATARAPIEVASEVSDAPL